MKKQEELIQKRAEKLQEECHTIVEFVKENNSMMGYQDATNVWMFRKLAELELQIDELKKNQRRKGVKGEN